MSYIASEWAFRQRVGSPMAKLVLARLAERADKDTGECHPSIDSIAAETELSRRTVIRQIAVLEAGGSYSRILVTVWVRRRLEVVA